MPSEATFLVPSIMAQPSQRVTTTTKAPRIKTVDAVNNDLTLTKGCTNHKALRREKGGVINND
ncbi:hypothetical protein F4604DRAFT_1925742 [Suillus subluteus]|nr:hypothetical protein F4604DRAFT_1925742 [Suillus subluteus]